MTTGSKARPMSPHLSIWRWRVHSITSITHRITGNGLALVGASLFVWWLVAAASGAAAYETFRGVATGWFGTLVGIGLTWALFQHMASGVRHLAMDTGAGFALGISKLTATLTWLVSIAGTVAVWVWILLR